MSFLPAARGSGRKARQSAIAQGRRAAGIPAARCHISEAALAALPNEQDAGLGWYFCANDIAARLSPSLTTRAAAGIIAALSPQIAWADNVAAARACALGADETEIQAIGALGDGIRKALAIRAGSDPAEVLGGRKVRSFFANVLRPDRSGPVTVDRHASAIALYGIGGPQPDDKWLDRAGRYQAIAAAYRSTARDFGILPSQIQAITWLAHRRTLDSKASGNLRAAHIRQRRNLPAAALSDGSEDF